MSDMPDEVQPALTAEEWTDFAEPYDDGESVLTSDTLWRPSMIEQLAFDGRFHAVAAVALHGQPFGFTQEDVEALREAVSYSDDTETLLSVNSYGERNPTVERLRSLAARIAALLPLNGAVGP